MHRLTDNRFQRGVYPAEDFTPVKKYGLNMLGMRNEDGGQPLTNIYQVSSDDQVKAYIKKIMSQLNKWMIGGKISRLVVVITSKETGEHVERWQFDVQMTSKSAKHRSSKKTSDKENTAPEYVTTMKRAPMLLC
jgi:mitotic spindle assembly checkpoint protein MAD2